MNYNLPNLDRIPKAGRMVRPSAFLLGRLLESILKVSVEYRCYSFALRLQLRLELRLT